MQYSITSLYLLVGIGDSKNFMLQSYIKIVIITILYNNNGFTSTKSANAGLITDFTKSEKKCHNNHSHVLSIQRY